MIQSLVVFGQLSNNNMKRVATLVLSPLLIVGLILGTSFSAIPAPLLAATETVVTGASGQPVNAQAAAYRQGINTDKGTKQSNGAANVAGKAVACSAGQILANLLTSAISKGVSTLTNKVGSQAKAAQKVPVNPDGTAIERAISLHSSATVGGTDPSGFALIVPGWDSIAWCIINSIIEYLVDSTIAWAQNGFNGNPAFVTNPEAFFQGIADQEAGAFLQEIGSKAAGGLNVCKPFQAQIVINLSRSFGNSGGEKGLSCSLSTIKNNYQGFVNGNFNNGGWAGWFELTQNDANNFYGATIKANSILDNRVAIKNNTATLELGWNKGFLSFKHCGDKTDPANPKDCVTDTPGTLIQSSLEKSLNLPKDRLVLAQKFDQLVTVLVDQLIQVALNKVLTSNSTQKTQ